MKLDSAHTLKASQNLQFGRYFKTLYLLYTFRTSHFTFSETTASQPTNTQTIGGYLTVFRHLHPVRRTNST